MSSLTMDRNMPRGMVLLGIIAGIAFAISGALFSVSGTASAQANDDDDADNGMVDDDDNGVDDNGMDDGMEDGADDNGADEQRNGAKAESDHDGDDVAAPGTGTGMIGGQSAGTGMAFPLIALGVVAMIAGAGGFAFAATRRHS